MGRKRRNKLAEGVVITGVADKGKGVGRIDNLVFFVEGAVPGDVVDVRIRKKRKTFAEGIVQNIVTPSPDRVEAFCQHFGSCGGCKWQNLAYETQLKHKQQVVVDAIQRIGKVDVKSILPIVPAEKIQFHRNKLEYTFSSRRWLTESEINSDDENIERRALGFHRPGAFNRVVDVEKCHLQAEPSNRLRNALKAFAIEEGYDFYDAQTHIGYLRNILVRTSSIGEVMIVLSLKYEDVEKRVKLLDFIWDNFPEMTSLNYVINSKVNDFILDLDIINYKGRAHIYEELGHCRFKIGPKSFFQTNTSQAVTLYDKVVEFADLKGTENVYDLYSGAGSIACYIAKDCKQVVGIEQVAPAIEDAKENANNNNIENTIFYAGDCKDVLTDTFAKQHGKPDVVITDPPRAGMHSDVVATLLKLAAPKVVYVSCNPSTQARDLALLSERYTVTKLQAVDMFPHTHHIETVALLTLIS